MGERPLVALVVEDDAPVRQLLDAILQTQGFERVLGSSWEDNGVRAAARWVDLVIVDHRLPGASGIEILAEVKGHRPDLRVIMLTGDPGAQERAELLGVDGFLLKPFDVSDLVDLIRHPGTAPIDLRPAGLVEVDVRSVDTPWFASS